MIGLPNFRYTYIIGFTALDRIIRKKLASLEAATYKACHANAYRRLAQAAPHYIVDSIAQCDVVIDDINARLAHGEKP